MGLKNRMGFLIKSQFNHLVTRSEDPEKVINQVVEEIDDGLDSARSRLSALKFRVEEDQRLLERIGEQISYWQGKAEGFIEDNMEENAKEAVRMRRILEDQERGIKIRHVEDEERLKEMGIALKELESRAQAVRAKRNILIKKMRLGKGETNEGREKRDITFGIEFKEPFSIFHKMEERIEGEEGFDYLFRDKQREMCEKEENLINEEIVRIKRKIKKEGGK
ncbi:MAG TPA: PspA/IM30 family protein [Thermodesulfobacteriota bacterium]